MKRVYSDEFKKYLIDHAYGRNLRDLMEDARRDMGVEITVSRLRSLLNALHINRFEGMTRSEMNRIARRPVSKYPPELKDWLLSQPDHRDVPLSEMLKRVNAHFGDIMTFSQFKCYLNNRHISLRGTATQYRRGSTPANKGRKVSAATYELLKATFFKPHNRPRTTLDVGTIVKTFKKLRNGEQESYYCKKIAERTWKMLHHIVWEEHNGPIPPGHVITFLDGNTLNCDISNLMCVSKAANACANQEGLRVKGQPDLTRTVLITSELKALVSRKRRSK